MITDLMSRARNLHLENEVVQVRYNIMSLKCVQKRGDLLKKAEDVETRFGRLLRVSQAGKVGTLRKPVV